MILKSKFHIKTNNYINMKQFKNILLVLILLSGTLVSCLKEEVDSPKVESVKFYTIDEDNKYQEVTDPQNGVQYTVAVKSNADIIVIWPGGEYETTKKFGTATDSIDINGNTVLTKSNCYKDYGMLHAQGLKTSLNQELGWVALYTYPEAGTFTATIISTIHGYDSVDYNQKIFNYEEVIK